MGAHRWILLAVIAVPSLTVDLSAQSGVKAGLLAESQARAQADDVDPCLVRLGSAGSRSFAACVERDGNISSIQKPRGNDHMFPLAPTEGFNICIDGQEGPRYFGGGFVPHAGWVGEPDVTQPNGPGTLPLTISRLGDGNLLITQKYKYDARNRKIDVVMRLTNVGSAPIRNLRLRRVLDADVEDTWANLGTARGDKVAMMNGPTTIVLEPVTEPHAHSVGLMEFEQFVFNDFASCGFGRRTEVREATDLVMFAVYDLGTLHPRSSLRGQYVEVSFVYELF